MLKGLDPLLTPDLLYTLARMGHGDTIAIVDRNFPAHSVHDRVIRLDGTDVVSAGRAVLGLLPLDTFVPEPVARMGVVGDATAEPPVQTEFIAAAEEASGRPVAVETVERHAFYARARSAFAVVITGEDRPYGCFLLTKGVLPEFSPER
ncbi:RbsD/FucU family protein [Streptomyces rhizosphaericus]|uniref:Fucose-binding protein n=1 Tax=Streptomyces rhizosphaericus TaxID=114699 RepID=A0A6G4ACS4_9ACTN|nr:RbsD/FucU domain-containing protein [Streptomyces rhizosphaericus]NEW70634.1 fucose-binding protein [Streptomyces rhizosphaericus]